MVKPSLFTDLFDLDKGQNRKKIKRLKKDLVE